ncbi:monoacylglycerol lipase ABHD6-like isoform X2 [Xyrauchen texanus]|uniref:monoacylglycerol lipase ABHD6-like isoform X2 n=1 Tax=Xyrauchen texanus TaxID=154827 RepID=UPI0022427E4E|nr:monoacylglycerol lipase ABHD6-like isoform X2 [Xyrauchen texanus]
MDLDMVNMFAIAAGTLAIPILLFMASFMLWPSSLIKVYYWYWRRTLGLQVRYADCGGYRFCYSYRGKSGHRPSILMLHDFSAHKDTWLPMVKYLPKHLHLLCVDMPGHEGTTRTNTDDYSIQGQAKRIRQFVEAIQLNRKPFHLVGTSMGGTVAGVYAACYPLDLCSVTLICPAGLKNQHKSKFDCQMDDVEHSHYRMNIPLIPSTPEEMEEMLKLCSHVRFRVPQQILQGLVDVRIPHNDFYQEVFMEIMSEHSKYALHEHIQQITTPLQIIWGKQDQVGSVLKACISITYKEITHTCMQFTNTSMQTYFCLYCQVVDVSGAAMLVEALQGCRVDLLENCGHSVVMERPRQTAKLILDFIISQQSTASASTKKKS